MEEKVLKFIETENLNPKGKTIICAISGGVDSICLLHLLHHLNYSLVLAHVNHHKRTESDVEEQEMKKLAKTLNIPFELLDYHDNHKDNFQAKAHEARYNFFKKVADQYQTNIIATAHHLNDQAETILMRMLSGSNLFGYGGISIKKEEDGYTFIRPLLCVSKQELYQYAIQHQLRYFEDASNQSNDYLRNRIRHYILPLFQAESPNYLDKFQEFSVMVKDSFNFIRKQSINYLDKLNNNIDVSSFICLDKALKADILCLLFERMHLEKNNTIIQNCMALIEKKQNRKINLKGDYSFILEYGKAFLQKNTSSIYFEEKLTLEGHSYPLNKYHFYFSKKIPQNNAKYLKLCYNDLKLPLLIRNKKEGDFITMSYGNKKVARIMIDEKIPIKTRNEIPLVFDRDDNLLWIYGIAKSEAVVSQKQRGDIYLICEEIV